MSLFAVISKRSDQIGLLITFSGLALVPPCTMFDFSTKLSGGIKPNPCYRIVLFFVGWLKQI